MAFIVKEMRSSVSVAEHMVDILNDLRARDFVPLIIEAKERYWGVFGENRPVGSAAWQPITFPKYWIDREGRISHFSFYSSERTNTYGDIFFSPQKKGFLYLLLLQEQRNTKDISGIELTDFLEVGFFGEDDDSSSLDNFAGIIVETLSRKGVSIELLPKQINNDTFQSLLNSGDKNFIFGQSICDEDIRLSESLEDQLTRKIAFEVKRSGGILATFLNRKFADEPRFIEITQELVQSNLFGQEWVVICRKTSNQINRVKSKNLIEKISQDGVLCSCGRPISEERVEELLVPTNILDKLLDKSYWMTLRLVHKLEKLGIPRNKIILNLLEGAEEVDAFVEVEGFLLMFELKDSEYSMGHSYAFGSRISDYAPNYALIVSSRGIDPQVKERFDRRKLETKLSYVNNLDELERILDDVIREINYRNTLEILDLLQPMSEELELQFTEVISSKIGLKVKKSKEGKDLSAYGRLSKRLTFKKSEIV